MRLDEKEQSECVHPGTWGSVRLRWIIDNLYIDLIWRAMNALRSVFLVCDNATRCPRTWRQTMTRASVYFLFLALLNFPSLFEIGGAPHTGAEYFSHGTPASWSVEPGLGV